MSQLSPERVKRFIVDEVTAESVKTVLMDSFMKKQDGDFHMKAAQMIALDLLQEGWKELERYKNHGEKGREPKKQRAL